MSKSSEQELCALDEVAGIAEKLAVLLSAGVAPATAWTYLAEPKTGVHQNVKAVAKAIEDGAGTVDAILATLDAAKLHPVRIATVPARARDKPSDTAWSGLAAAWLVATEAGAPLAQALKEFSFSLRALAQARRAAETALSGPVATAKLVLVLPIVGILFGVALGFDTIGTLVFTAPGLGCLAAGGSLLLVARRWNRALVRSSTPADHTPGLQLDLLAVAVSGGASIEKARTSVASALQRSGSAPSTHDAREADAVFALSQRAGVPAGVLLRSEAERVRRVASSEAERKAAKLAVTLMLPLGICVLPAFMLLGVAPLMISVLSSTVSGL